MDFNQDIEPKAVIVGVRFIEPDGLDESSPYLWGYLVEFSYL
jgi:hypothetical protein